MKPLTDFPKVEVESMQVVCTVPRPTLGVVIPQQEFNNVHSRTGHWSLDLRIDNSLPAAEFGEIAYGLEYSINRVFIPMCSGYQFIW